MKKAIWKYLYAVWTVASLVVSLRNVIKFWPDYYNNDNPLFTDISIITLFLPSYFLMLWLIIHIIIIVFKNYKTRAVLISTISITLFIISIGLIDFYSLFIRGLISFVCFMVTGIHFVITSFIHKKVH